VGRLPIHGAGRDQVGGYPDSTPERAEAVPLWEPASSRENFDRVVTLKRTGSEARSTLALGPRTFSG
jgi:hypothetical protein